MKNDKKHFSSIVCGQNPGRKCWLKLVANDNGGCEGPSVAWVTFQREFSFTGSFNGLCESSSIECYCVQVLYKFVFSKIKMCDQKYESN